jgi:hypothetical protein
MDTWITCLIWIFVFRAAVVILEPICKNMEVVIDNVHELWRMWKGEKYEATLDLVEATINLETEMEEAPPGTFALLTDKKGWPYLHKVEDETVMVHPVTEKTVDLHPHPEWG